MSATIHDFPGIVRDLNASALLAQRTVVLDRELAAARARIATLEAKLAEVDEDLTTVMNALVATGALSVEVLR